MRENPASSVGITVSNPNAGRTTNTRGNRKRTGTRRAFASAWRRSSARCSAARRARAGPTGLEPVGGKEARPRGAAAVGTVARSSSAGERGAERARALHVPVVATRRRPPRRHVDGQVRRAAGTDGHSEQVESDGQLGAESGGIAAGAVPCSRAGEHPPDDARRQRREHPSEQPGVACAGAPHAGCNGRSARRRAARRTASAAPPPVHPMPPTSQSRTVVRKALTVPPPTRGCAASRARRPPRAAGRPRGTGGRCLCDQQADRARIDQRREHEIRKRRRRLRPPRVVPGTASAPAAAPIRSRSDAASPSIACALRPPSVSATASAPATARTSPTPRSIGHAASASARPTPRSARA